MLADGTSALGRDGTETPGVLTDESSILDRENKSVDTSTADIEADGMDRSVLGTAIVCNVVGTVGANNTEENEPSTPSSCSLDAESRLLIEAMRMEGTWTLGRDSDVVGRPTVVDGTSGLEVGTDTPGSEIDGVSKLELSCGRDIVGVVISVEGSSVGASELPNGSREAVGIPVESSNVVDGRPAEVEGKSKPVESESRAVERPLRGGELSSELGRFALGWEIETLEGSREVVGSEIDPEGSSRLVEGTESEIDGAPTDVDGNATLAVGTEIEGVSRDSNDGVGDTEGKPPETDGASSVGIPVGILTAEMETDGTATEIDGD